MGSADKWSGRCRNGRVLRPEWLGSAPKTLAADNLRDLERLNRWTGGLRILDALLAERVGTDETFTLLDVGSASGVARAVVNRFPLASVCSLDRREFHISGAPPPKLVGDAFALPFRPGSFDFVFCSLLLHEFSDGDVTRLLRSFHDVARRALVVLDLYRHPIPYHFLPATRKLFGWGDVTLHDGPVSVEAGFLPSELQRLASDAGIAGARASRHLPWFRVSLVADREVDLEVD